MKKALGWRIDETLKQNVIDEGAKEKRKPAAHLEKILEERFTPKQGTNHTPKKETK